MKTELIKDKNLKRREVKMMRKIFLFLTVLMLIIGLSSIAQAVPVLQIGDIAFKFHDLTYFDDPNLAPGQDPVPGGTGSGRAWGVANVDSIHKLSGGTIENPILSPVPIWTPSATDLLQIRFGGLMQSYCNPACPPFPGFPYDAYFIKDPGVAYQSPAGNAYIEIYSRTSDGFVADYAAGPGAGSYGSFGANIAGAGGSLWLDLKIEDGVLPFYDPLAGPAVIEKSTATGLTTGASLMYSTIVGGTAANQFLIDVFPLFAPAWGTLADPDPTHDRADIRLKSNLTAIYDPTQPAGFRWYDTYGWTHESQDPVTGRVIPEPNTLLLLGSGFLCIIGIGIAREKRKK